MVIKNGQKAQVLVIHEDLSFARTLEGLFQEAGYTVTIAGSIGHALWLMDDTKFQIAVFAFDSPPLKDLIVLHKLHEKQSQLKLIVYGAVKTQIVLNYLARAGADVIINRSETPEEVLKSVGLLVDASIGY